MTDDEFDHWCKQQQLTAQTLLLIAAIRAAPPSRRVQGRAKNVSGVYPSRKMGQTIQFESHTVELWAIYQMEHDPQVLEFYDQPPPFKIQYQNQNGRKIGHYHTPDFFVLRLSGAAWEEWKTETELKRLAQKYPSRYQKTETGHWHCPPGEAYAASYGLKYHVRTDTELNPIFTQNLMFLEDYFRFTANIPHFITEQILAAVQATPGTTIAATLTSIPGVRANDIYAMIATEQVYVDLYAVPLVEHWRVQLWADQQTHTAHTHLAIETTGHKQIPSPTTLLPNTLLVWDAQLWTLVNLGEKATTLLPEVGQPMQLPTAFFLQLFDSGTINIHTSETHATINSRVRELMDTASPSDLLSANRRFHLVQAYFQHRTDIYKDIPQSTLSRWVKQFREAEATFGCGYVGLLPRTASRGNRQPKAPTDASILLDQFITEHFETPRQAPAASVYRAYTRACCAANIPPLSQRTFYTRLKKRPIHEQTLKRQGAKAAYATEAIVLELVKTTPRHGDRPFAICHLDHTQLDIELRSQVTGRNLGRPWLTLLIDAYSRRILAVYLTFDPPSYRSCMMALRLCVQRFGRFPQSVVVDGGKEFHSVYFDTLLARYHCIKKTRPGAKPRFGSVVERLFGTTNTEFIFNLLGNTQASKQPRQLTKVVDPKQLAVWTLADLYTYLSEWAYTIYDISVHDTLGETPLQVYTDAIVATGEREHRHIAYNEDFLMATRPSTPKGNAKVQPGQGIKVNYLYYWNDAFRNPVVEKTKVSVRYDPFDMGVAYAYLEGRWVKCISQYYSTFAGRTEKEVLLAAQEIRQQDKRNAVSTNISAKRLADFIAAVQEHEILLMQRLRDLEAVGVLENLTPNKEGVPQFPRVSILEPTMEPHSQDDEQLPALQNNVELLDITRLPMDLTFYNVLLHAPNIKPNYL
ncbi:TnsA endonuclease N-terminal domain-containing protein [Nostoc sp. FACHB-892]|uniref:TnsA endonuclease N-terminal domain-containing protein n=1 Tax=Nostoc sp. FACHB-892 TaxID=2692843 RepID=UPI0016883BBE|nr:TnsA endonuclease N-terminal domain-containing protein [Nostoc sp. FACHB-892]MBD2731807.1 TnsA endonuclease N-terminal domain-containing protein [Nostoc sp. FACHB-892]